MTQTIGVDNSHIQDTDVSCIYEGYITLTAVVHVAGLICQVLMCLPKLPYSPDALDH